MKINDNYKDYFNLQGENEASDCESSSKKAKKDEEEKVEDFAHESVENWMYPNVEKSDYGVEYPNMSAHGDEALNYLQGKSTEQLLLEPPFYYQYGLFNLFSDENQNNNGKGNNMILTVTNSFDICLVFNYLDNQEDLRRCLSLGVILEKE